MQNESICIICFGSENLKKNQLCYNKCNFFYHENCYINWQKTKTQRNTTCIVCKDPVLNFITGEVSVINPLVRYNDIELNNNNTNYVDNESSLCGETNECIKKLLAMLIITMLMLIVLTFLLTLI